MEDAVMGILTEYWDDIWSSLDAGQRGELAGLLRALTLRIDDDSASPLIERIVQIIGSALPDVHPVRLELVRQSRSADGAEPGWRQLPRVLTALAAQLVRQQARERLLGASALSAEQVRAGGEDPDHRFLIRLRAPNGEYRIPAFQFGPDGRAIDLVLDVNKALGSDGDPWGVADWWLGPNSWLQASPADLIGREDHQVWRAAAAMAEQAW